MTDWLRLIVKVRGWIAEHVRKGANWAKASCSMAEASLGDITDKA